MTITPLSFAFKHIAGKPVRSLILLLSISVIVTMVVFSLSFVYRIHSGVKKMTDRLGADLLVVPAGARGFAEDILLENRVKTVYMERSVLERLSKIKGIDKMTSQTYLVTLSGLCCGVPETTVVLFDQDTDFIVQPWLEKALKRKLDVGEAVVGYESAYNIDLGLVDLDSMLFGNVFKIVGVLEKTGSGLDSAIFITEKNLDNIIKNSKAHIKPNEVSIVFIKAKEGYDHNAIMREIADNIIEVNAVARKDIGKGIISSLKDINMIFIFSSTLTSLLAALLAWSVFSATINERSEEIGIMRAIGAKDRDVARLFITEVLIIGILGGILGTIAGNILSILLTKNFSILKNISSDISILSRAVIALVSIGFGSILCIAGALLPLKRVVKIEPLLALKGR